MPDSGKAPDVVSGACDVLQDIIAVKVAAGHSHVLLGDLNARVGSAAAAGQRIGQYGEPGQPNLAGKELISLLSASDACLLNSRTPGGQ